MLEHLVAAETLADVGLHQVGDERLEQGVLALGESMCLKRLLEATIDICCVKRLVEVQLEEKAAEGPQVDLLQTNRCFLLLRSRRDELD